MSTSSSSSLSGSLGPLSPMTTGFSTSFAQPLKKSLPKTYSEGYSGSPRAFFNSVLINGDKQLRECSAKPFKSIDGSPCAYMDVRHSSFSHNLLYSVVVGIAVPVITVIYCCGFFCARNGGQRCKCCGAMCRQPNCGGTYPTVIKYPTTEKRCCCCGFLLNWIVICVLAVLGFLCTNESNQDIQLVVNSVNSAINYAPVLKGTMASSLTRTQDASLAYLDATNINARLASQSLDALIASFRAVCDGLGCATAPPDFSSLKNSTGGKVDFDSARDVWVLSGAAGLALPGVTCCVTNTSWTASQTNWNISVADPNYYINKDPKPPDCILQGTEIMPMVNSRAGYSCCRCLEISQRLSASKGGLAKMSENMQILSSGNVDRVSLVQAIAALSGPLNASIDAFSTSMSSINKILLQSSQALTNQAGIVGGSATVWSLAIVSATCGFVGLLLSIQCCWWTSYCLGIVNVIIFFALFGAFALIALPFGDICTGMPKINDGQIMIYTWLATFSPTVRISDLSPDLIGAYTGCLIPSDGDLFRVVGRDKLNISRGLKSAVGEISATSAINALNAPTYTPGFAESVVNIQGDFSSSSSLQSALVAASASISTLNVQATTSYTSSLISILRDRDFLLGNVTDMLWSSANCSSINGLYNGFRDPLCNRMSHSLDSIWVLFFFIGIAWFPMFLIICRSSKHSLSRKGVYNLPVDDDDLNIKDIREAKDEESGLETPETPVEGKSKEKRKKSKKKGSTASSHRLSSASIASDASGEGEGGGGGDGGGGEEREAVLERKKKAK